MNHLIIGLGGTGGKSIRALRKLILAEQRYSSEVGKNVNFLYVDSSAEMMSQSDPTWKILGKSVQLSPSSQLQITGEDLTSVLNNINNYPGIKGWIGSQVIWKEILGTIIGEALGGQKRRLGRFLFARKIKEFNSQVQSLVQSLQQNGDSNITFHILAGLAGGTGSGCIVDAISQLRNTYQDGKKFRIMPYLLLPDQYPLPNWDTGNYHANGYAALTEINALSTNAYKPIDVSNGNILTLKDPFNGAYIICNENENGYIAKINTEVPEILAEFLFQKIFVAGVIGLTSITRMENGENGDGTPETSVSSKTGERSKRFLAFGIKRISIPEDEIQEYLILSFAQQGIQQLRFNNWQQSIGYANEVKNIDANAIVRLPENQSKWLISDEYLTLADSILKSDDPKRIWKSLSEEWSSVVSAFKQLTQQQDPKFWITFISNLFQKRFDESYRNLGVKEFYRTKLLSKQSMAKEIRRYIELDLIEQWKNGSKSLYEIIQIIESLTLLMLEKLDGFEGRNIKSETQLDDYRMQIASNLNDWASISFIGKAFGKRDNIFERHSLVLQSYYIELTRQEANIFAKSLIYEIVSELRILKLIVDDFSANIQQATEQISKDLNERLVQNTSNDTKSHVIRFYEAQQIRGNIRDLVINESLQSAHSSKIRSLIISRLGDDVSFAKFDERFSTVNLVDDVTAVSEESAISAHTNMLAQTNNKILGVSILAKLEDRYGSDNPALRLKIHELVTQAGTFLTINPLERDKAAPGIPVGAQVLIAKTVVMLPKPSNKEGFITILKEAFRASMSGDLEFIEIDNKQNEITILSIKNLFPIRMIGVLPFLKEKFIDRTKLSNQRMEMELFTSGTLNDFPNLFAQSGSDLAKLAGTQLLLAYGLGLITKDLKSHCLIFNSKDSDGFDNPPIQFDSSILIAISNMDFSTLDIITIEVDKKLLQIFDILQVESLIKGLVETSKIDSGSNPGDSELQKLIECAKIALQIVRAV